MFLGDGHIEQPGAFGAVRRLDDSSCISDTFQCLRATHQRSRFPFGFPRWENGLGVQGLGLRAGFHSSPKPQKMTKEALFVSLGINVAEHMGILKHTSPDVRSMIFLPRNIDKRALTS